MAVLAVASLTIAAVLLGAARWGADGSPRSTYSLEEARAFSAFPVYYAGESIDGVPLVAVLRRDDTAKYISFIYGECEATDQTGCAPPGEVQVWPACVRNPASYATNRSSIAPQSRSAFVRGAPAQTFEDEHRLEIQTGTSTVVIFGRTPELARALADGLRGVNNEVTTNVALPPPAVGALEGKLSC